MCYHDQKASQKGEKNRVKSGELRNWLWSEGAPMKRNWLAAALYVVAALALLASQMVGYIIKCCGF